MTIKGYATAVSQDFKKDKHLAVWSLYDAGTLLKSGVTAYKGTTHNRACAWAVIHAADALSGMSLDEQKGVQLLTDLSYIGRYFANWEQYQYWQQNGFETSNGSRVKNLDLVFLYWLIEGRAPKRIQCQFVPLARRDEQMVSFIKTAKCALPAVVDFGNDPGGQSVFEWSDLISCGLIDFDTAVSLQGESLT